MESSLDEVQAMLVRRGLVVVKTGPGEDCLLPEPRHLDSYYRMLHRYSFRLFLRDVIRHQERITPRDVGRYAGEESAAADIEYLASIGLVAPDGDTWRLTRTAVPSFGRTLEWYVAEVLRRELLAPSLINVRLGSPGLGGDYDVLAKLDDRLLYVEAKSSPPKQIYDTEVAAFLGRAIALGPEIAVFLVDTRLRMRDKIVPMFDQELGRLPGAPALAPLERQIFHARSRVFVCNSQPDVAANLAAILRAYHRGRQALL